MKFTALAQAALVIPFITGVIATPTIDTSDIASLEAVLGTSKKGEIRSSRCLFRISHIDDGIYTEIEGTDEFVWSPELSKASKASKAS
ncbi:hypothetical protein DL771_002187 [Monosporascus sp. 5C6A]|nr:hypothetical protein DL771_002187 [Monosporascus sp. 5C6A]